MGRVTNELNSSYLKVLCKIRSFLETPFPSVQLNYIHLFRCLRFTLQDSSLLPLRLRQATDSCELKFKKPRILKIKSTTQVKYVYLEEEDANKCNGWRRSPTKFAKEIDLNQGLTTINSSRKIRKNAFLNGCFLRRIIRVLIRIICNMNEGNVNK